MKTMDSVLDKIKKPRVLALILAAALLALFYFCEASAQSSRRPAKRLGTSPAKDARAAEAPKERVYVVLGRVVDVAPDGAVATAQIKNLAAPEGWTSVFYTTDLGQQPLCILEPPAMFFKNCAVFKAAQGAPSVGDILMLCHIPPEEED